MQPRFISDTHRLNRDRYVFVSSRSDDKVATKPEPMNQSMVSQCLTRSFEKSEVFQGKESFPRMSCSKIRFSIITELICLGKDELENIAHCFAKHDKKVCKRFYVQFWNNREAVRLSWKCYSMYKYLSEMDQKAVNQWENILGKKVLPSSDIKRWYEQKKNMIKSYQRSRCNRPGPGNYDQKLQ